MTIWVESMGYSLGSLPRHCEERSDEAIQILFFVKQDWIACIAPERRSELLRPQDHPIARRTGTVTKAAFACSSG